MTDRYAAPRGGWSPAGRSDDESWARPRPITAADDRAQKPDLLRRVPVIHASVRPVHPVWAPRNRVRSVLAPAADCPRSAAGADADDWSPAGTITRDKQRANRLMERQLRELRTTRKAHERGIPWWAALLVMIVIAALGGLIDTVGSIQVRGGFNIGIVVASIVAIVLVKRSHMFPVVIAPPIVYSLGAVFQLYLRSSGLHDKKVVLDAAANYLVYGFPAIAAATAAVLIISGIRMITRK